MFHSTVRGMSLGKRRTAGGEFVSRRSNRSAGGFGGIVDWVLRLRRLVGVSTLSQCTRTDRLTFRLFLGTLEIDQGGAAESGAFWARGRRSPAQHPTAGHRTVD